MVDTRKWVQHSNAIFPYGEPARIAMAVRSTDDQVFIQCKMDWADQRTWFNAQQARQFAHMVLEMVDSLDRASVKA